MKNLVILATILGAAVLFSACSEKKPLTPEEQWHGYCTSIGNAARSILLDRQNGITLQQAEDHAAKLTDPTTKSFVETQIEKVYAFPKKDLEKNKDSLLAQFKQEGMDACLATPFDERKLPDYKQF